MNEDKIASVVAALNRLLAEQKSLHLISFEFDNLAQEIRTLGLSFRIVTPLEYYLDDELTFLHHQEKRLFAEGNVLRAIKARQRKRQLLRLKEGAALKQLHREPSVFSLELGIITARLNKFVPIERLLINLIEGYDLRTRK